VVEPLSLVGFADFPNEANQQSILAEMSSSAEAYLSDIAARHAWEGVDVSYKVTRGDPASLILDEVDGETDILIAMSTHGRSEISR
jgi:nucleotide-binding universal stress UspA family protein